MAYFANQKLLELAAARNARLEYVRNAYRAATENVYTVEHILAPAISLAREERERFRDWFGEPMPRHVGNTLEAEIGVWDRLKLGLARLRDQHVTSEQLDAYALRVRSYLAAAGDLLRVEEAMVTSCLVDHHEHQRNDILNAIVSLDITRI